MKQKLLFAFCIILGSSVFVGLQTRLVTNADLEKFKLERLKAEAEYRENYARWGFPSPEELDRRREQSRVESEALSVKLRSERLERERTEAERQAREQRAAAYYHYASVLLEQQDSSPLYFLSFGRYRRHPIRQQQYPSGYFAGGHFWPTPTVRHVSRPMWIRR